MVGYRIGFQTRVNKMVCVRWCCVTRMRNNGCWNGGSTNLISNRNVQDNACVMVVNYTHEDVVGQVGMSKVR